MCQTKLARREPRLQRSRSIGNSEGSQFPVADLSTDPPFHLVDGEYFQGFQMPSSRMQTDVAGTTVLAERMLAMSLSDCSITYPSSTAYDDVEKDNQAIEDSGNKFSLRYNQRDSHIFNDLLEVDLDVGAHLMAFASSTQILTTHSCTRNLN
jgi:hypothetical protein